ncbi:MAG: hypothetical protein PQJ58_06720 [Spirochaetales bacterium]|nr:hypothetical protein [Spirochaetales bacterium]
MEEYNNKSILGLGMRIIKSEDMKDEYFIFHDLSGLTNGRYPYVYLSVQHSETENNKISRWIIDNGFKEII